jgi:predicted small integral membrane protein
MTGSPYGGMIAAITISLCQYHLDDIYVRSAVGEYTAFIFIPVVIYALYNIIYEEADKPHLFVIGYAGVLLCHTATFIMCTIFGIAALLLNFKKTVRDIKVFKRLLISTAATLMLTCFYWLPMLEQFMHASFYVSTPWMQPKDEAVGFLYMFGAQFPSLGYICVLILIPRIFMRKNAVSDKPQVLGYADLLILAGFLFTVITSDLIPWERIGRYVSFIQFPWRFFIMGSTLFSVAAGLIYSRMMGSDEEMTEIMTFNKEAGTRVINAGAVILVIILIMNGISAFNVLKNNTQGYYDYSDDYYSYKPYTGNVIAGEWLPSSVKDRDKLIDDSELMIADNGKKLDFVRVKNTVEADINGNFEYVDVPFIYYLGYKAQITDDSGKVTALPVTGEGHNGMCRVYMQGSDKGRLRVSYRGTPVIHISLCISIISLIMILAILIKEEKGAGRA